MLKKQFLLTATIIGIAIGLFIILKQLNWDNSHTNISNRITPNDLLIKAMSSEKYIDVDALTTHIINEDPSYVLIDLRDEQDYHKFTLPKAKNIAPDVLLKADYKPIFDTEAHKVVLFSNGTLVANKVWILLRREGYQNVMVLDGGMNAFYKTIINPTKPTDTDSKVAFDLYRFRKAAAVYFGLPNPDEFIPKQIITPAENSTKTTTLHLKKKKILIKPKATPKKVVEEEEDEGC